MFTLFATGCMANCDCEQVRNAPLSHRVRRTYNWHSANLLRLQAEDEMTDITQQQVMTWQTLCTGYRAHMHLHTPANAVPVNTLHSRSIQIFTTKYSRAPVSADSVSVVYSCPPKNRKIKEINGLYISKRVTHENRLYHGETQQPKHAQYLTHLLLSPYPC
jgi:hypothetical protein